MSRMAPPSDKVFYIQKSFRTEEIQQLASALTTKWHIEREVYQALDLMKTEARNLATELCSEKDRFNSFKKLTTSRKLRMSEMKDEIYCSSPSWAGPYDTASPRGVSHLPDSLNHKKHAPHAVLAQQST